MNFKTRLTFVYASIFLAAFSACSPEKPSEEQTNSNTLPFDSIKEIAKEAYIYGFPMVDAYRIQYSYFVDSLSPEYKGPMNILHSASNVYTSADKTIQTPNSDTPYSMLGMDLRTEPMVLIVPKIDKSRYFSIQLVDAYTANFDYIGSRTTGNSGGAYMVAGPNWKGEVPKGVDKVFTCETEIGLCIYRTQLFNPADIENVRKIQAGYKAVPLSTFLNTPPPAALPPIKYITPLSVAKEKSSIEFFSTLNFLLQFCPTSPTEKVLMERFAKIGIGAGLKFDTTAFSAEVKNAYKQGIKEAWTIDFVKIKKLIEEGKVTSNDVFGTRAYLKNNYLYRMAAAVLGIFGNTAEEAIYPMYEIDSEGNKLDATTNKYTLHFNADQLPPVNAFWSLTMYEMPASLLVENPLNRYLLNSPMLSSFKRDKDGGITFYLQNESPGKEKEANWLPAPKGPFLAVLRLYWPKESALNGKWIHPAIQLVK